MQNNNDKNQLAFAGFWPRFVAFCIDGIIVFGLQCILGWFTSDVTIGLEEMQYSGLLLASYVVEDFLMYIVMALYFTLFTYITGTTLGKRVMNLRVVNKDGSTQLNLLNIIYRETVGKFLCKMTVGIGYLIIGFDPDKRGLHDMLCDTQVIYAKTVKVYKEFQSVPPRAQVPFAGYQLRTEEEPRVEESRTEAEVLTSENVQAEAELQMDSIREEKEVLGGYHLTDEPKVDIVDEENIIDNNLH